MTTWRTTDTQLYETSIEIAIMDDFIQKVKGRRPFRPRPTTSLDY